MAAAQRPFHVVVWGASGFTGRLVCEHVARDYKGKVRWAMAGRNKERLEKLRLELSQTYGEDLKDVPILLGDLSDQSSLDAIAKDANVVITVAGPYVRLGTPIAEAALRQGTHYVDITGETSYVMNLIRNYHEEAERKGVKLVPNCGFDSIPSDLGAYLVVDHMKRQLGKAAARVVTVMVDGKGGVSGGTVASGMEQKAEATKRGMPLDSGVYSFLPPGAPRGDDGEFWGVGWEPTLKRWLAPFVMQVINNRVVHRSAYLLGPAAGYGSNFHYQEASAAPSWWSAKLMALATGATINLIMNQQWLQPLLKKVLPAPGQGPSRDAMMNGRYRMAVVGYSQEEGDAKPTAVVAEVADPHRDPGYWGTSRMLLEAALCLALQQEELAAAGLPRGGVLTPAAAMNSLLIERLRKAGVTYEVREVVRPQ